MLRLVTDSTADLPTELVARHNILVVPAIVLLDGRPYRDGIELSRGEFYERLPTLKQLPQTASPAIGEYEAAYRQCGDADVISLHMAAGLSGIYNAARLAAEPFGPRLTLVDTGQVSMGLGWQVIAAAEAITAGQSLPAVLAAIKSTRRRVKVYALLDTLAYLRRGGRANAITSSIGDILQIKLIVELAESQVIQLVKHRTRSKAIEKLIELAEALGPLERLAILHTQAPAEAEALAARLASRAAQPPLIVEATSVIGTHVGPQALGIAAVKSE
jgi:DegV family protein with EDD domain